MRVESCDAEVILDVVDRGVTFLDVEGDVWPGAGYTVGGVAAGSSAA
jgi:hypothetical protein